MTFFFFIEHAVKLKYGSERLLLYELEASYPCDINMQWTWGNKGKIRADSRVIV